MSEGPRRDSVLGGFWRLALANLVLAVLLFVLLAREGRWLDDDLLDAPFFLLGLIQLLYGVPYALALRREGRRRAENGAWLAMGLTALLNGGCRALFLWG